MSIEAGLRYLGTKLALQGVVEYPEYEAAALVPRELYAIDVRNFLTEARSYIGGLSEGEFNRRDLDKNLRAIPAAEGASAGAFFSSMRVAIAGHLASPGLFETMMALGKESTLRRLDEAIRKLSVVA
jgi:glutamyl/glutaminyl-tRNA synthetase